jgi:DnaJ-class molecular chaperone
MEHKMNELRKQILGAPHAFALLGVHLQSTDNELHEARRRLAMRLHPDLCDSSDATDLMARVNVALRELTVDRKRYILTLGGRECQACGGRGATSKNKSFVKVERAVCGACMGSGRG